MSQPGMMSQEGNMSQPGMMSQEGTSQQTVELEECWASQSSRGVSALDETGAAIDADSQPTASQQSSQGALTQDTAADVAEAHVAHVAHAGAAASQKTALQAELTAVGDEYRQHRDAMHPPISAAERYAAVKEAVTVHLSTVPPPSAAELACFERRQPFCVRVPPPSQPPPSLQPRGYRYGSSYAHQQGYAHGGGNGGGHGGGHGGGGGPGAGRWGQWGR